MLKIIYLYFLWTQCISVRGSKFPKSTISSFSPCDIIHIYIVAVSIRDIAYYNPFVTSWTSPSLSIKFCQYTSLYKLWDARNMQTRCVSLSLSIILYQYILLHESIGCRTMWTGGSPGRLLRQRATHPSTYPATHPPPHPPTRPSAHPGSHPGSPIIFSI